MRNHCSFPGLPASRAGVLATLFLMAVVAALVACNQSPSPAATPAASAPKAATREVYVVFEGPWAIVADPKDANSVLIIAPKTKIHRDLFVAASNDLTLAAGAYDLSVPPHGPATTATLDARFAQVKIDAKSLQHALDAKSARYVVRLPKPEAYVAARRYRSRVGPTYAPDASTEQDYASSVSFLYNVSTLSGFSVAGTPDVGSFDSVPLQLDTPTIRFAIEPAQADDPKDLCNTHSREAFRDTTKFLGLTLFVDFPNDPSTCHESDPQNVHPAKAEAGNPASFLKSPSWASRILDRSSAQSYPFALMYLFFHGSGVDCHPPILFLTVTP